ncbi:MAG: RNA methyltransferase [Planctomycetota bacterium]
MAETQAITSVNNVRVKQVVKLREKARERKRQGLLIAEGRREVERARAAGLRPMSWFVSEDNPQASALMQGEPTWVSGAVMRKMAYHTKPEGVLAVFEAPRWSLADLPVNGDGFYLVAVGTEKPGNLGAMVRTAAAAGCDAVLAVAPEVDVFNPAAIRNSTGAVFGLPTVVVEDDAVAIAWLRERGVVAAAALADGGTDCFAADWGRGATAVVIGPEHAGLGEAWRTAAGVALTIPSAGGGGVDSLNASNAAAVLLFEAVRRRASAGGGGVDSGRQGE